MNPQKYNIVVSQQEIDDEQVFVGRALEFPDVRVFESSHDAAYIGVTEVIEDLIDMAGELGHEIPAPIVEDEQIFSGKMTFRPGKTLHRKIAEAALEEDISQNQLLCNFVSAAIAEKDLSRIVSQRIDRAVRHSWELGVGFSERPLSGGFTVARGQVGLSGFRVTEVTSAGIAEEVALDDNPYQGGGFQPSGAMLAFVKNQRHG